MAFFVILQRVCMVGIKASFCKAPGSLIFPGVWAHVLGQKRLTEMRKFKIRFWIGFEMSHPNLN